MLVQLVLSRVAAVPRWLPYLAATLLLLLLAGTKTSGPACSVRKILLRGQR